MFCGSNQQLAMKYKLVLWDFDGTLADTLTIALGIYNRMALKKRFKPITDPESVREMNMREFLKSHNVPAYRVPLAFNTFLKELRRLAPEICLNSGISGVLQSISDLGIRQGVVSSNATETICQCLEANLAKQHFAFISGTSKIFGKERRLKKAIKESGCGVHEVLYVGDEIRDIEASRAADMDIAAAGWGLNSATALATHSPTHLISHPDELLEILKR